jgi:CRP-like cAMP-binding protein
VQKLNEIKSTAIYPKATMLFIEGQQPPGVFVLCAGKAKLSTSSSDGKTVILKISEPGDVLGLNAAISNRPYEVTAEMVEPGRQISLPEMPCSNFCVSMEKSRYALQNSSVATTTRRMKKSAP